MASKKWLIVTGVLAVIGAGLVLLGLAANNMYHEAFKKNLMAIGNGATGAFFEIGESDLNIFTGQGSVKSITVSEGPSDAVFEAVDVTFKVQPFSLIYGAIDVTTLTVGELNVAVSVSAGTSNISKILASALDFSEANDRDSNHVRLIIRKLSILKGDVRVRVKIFGGKLVTKSTSLQPVNMAGIGENEGGLPPEIIAYDLLKEVGSSVVNRALQNL